MRVGALRFAQLIYIFVLNGLRKKFKRRAKSKRNCAPMMVFVLNYPHFFGTRRNMVAVENPMMKPVDRHLIISATGHFLRGDVSMTATGAVGSRRRVVL